jgi:hypothetical protein
MPTSRITLLASIALSCLVSPIATAQGTPRAWVDVATGPSIGSGDGLLKASGEIAARLTIGVRVVSGWDVEISRISPAVVAENDVACVALSGNPPIEPSDYMLSGTAIALRRQASVNGAGAMGGIELGIGRYRVDPGPSCNNPGARSVTSVGLHAAVYNDLVARDNFTLFFALRETCLPGVQAAPLWITQIELGLRVPVWRE